MTSLIELNTLLDPIEITRPPALEFGSGTVSGEVSFEPDIPTRRARGRAAGDGGRDPRALSGGVPAAAVNKPCSNGAHLRAACAHGRPRRVLPPLQRLL